MSLSFCTVRSSFFSDTAPTQIYTLSLHDALPILSLHPSALDTGRIDSIKWIARKKAPFNSLPKRLFQHPVLVVDAGRDRKSTRLNSSHLGISYAVFCLKKKNKNIPIHTRTRLTTH